MCLLTAPMRVSVTIPQAFFFLSLEKAVLRDCDLSFIFVFFLLYFYDCTFLCISPQLFLYSLRVFIVLVWVLYCKCCLFLWTQYKRLYFRSYMLLNVLSSSNKKRIFKSWKTLYTLQKKKRKKNRCKKKTTKKKTFSFRKRTININIKQAHTNSCNQIFQCLQWH